MFRFLVLLGVWCFATSARAEKIVFATYDDIPPKVYREGTELKGTYIEIVREVCKRMNVEPVTYTRNMAFALKKSKVKITGLEDFKKLTVGVNDRYSYGPVFDAFKKKLRLDHSTSYVVFSKGAGSHNSTRWPCGS